MQGEWAKQRAAVAERREAEFEAYERWEYQRRLYDEITDVAERVRAPISPTQEFTLTSEGLMSARGELLRPIVEGGLAEAQRMALTNPDWAVEVTRREIELSEYDDYEVLARQGYGAQVSYWLIPDAVRNGDSSLPGYNRERLKMFTRVAMATGRGVIVKYHSYDGSYLPGVQAMDEALGRSDFDPTRSSEEIAAQRRHLPVPTTTIEELDEILRRAYDGAMSRVTHCELDSGRPPLAVKDVMGFIAAQDKLLGEHMSELANIFALTRNTYERNELMKSHRFNLAAAIDDLLHGKQVTSAVEAGDGARSEGRNLDGDCATGDETTATQQLDSLGFKIKKETPSIWGAGDCVACLEFKLVAINKCNMCQDCEDVHNQSGDVGLERVMEDAKKRRQKALARSKKIAILAMTQPRITIFGFKKQPK
jgi:hypothetical protein